jgi:hypothetical protein
MIRKLTLLGCCCLLSATVLAQQPIFKPSASADSLKKMLTFLASDSLKGRATGSSEQQVAARYIAAKLKQYGLKGASTETENPYFSTFYRMRYSIPTDYKIKIKDSDETLSPYTDMHVACGKELASCSIIPIAGQVDSLSGPNVAQVVMAPTLDEGMAQVKRGLATTPTIKKYLLALPPEKMKEYNKARNVLQLSQAAYTTPKGDTMLLGWTNETYPLSSNVCHAKVLAFVKSHPSITLLVMSQRKLKLLFSDSALKAYAASRRPAVGKAVVIDGAVPPDNIKERKVANVVGILEGATDEAIVVSAHYDHIGIREREKHESATADTICNGADDNGSGTSAILEVARLFAEAKAQGIQPKRSIIVTAFTGEELGLLGSKFMMHNPCFPIAKIKANVNLDMVGRTDAQHSSGDMYAYTISLGDSVALQKIVDLAAQKAKVDLSTEFDPEERNMWREGSDHDSFMRKGIPAIVVTTGMHPDYHQPSDEVSKINFKRMARITNFTCYMLWELANQ